MWNVKCFVIPAATVATGFVTTDIKKVSSDNTRHSLNRLFAKTAVLEQHTWKGKCYNLKLKED
jgi:hypothetical protein